MGRRKLGSGGKPGGWVFRDRVLLFSRCGLEHTERCPASEEIWDDVLAAGRVVLEPTSGIQTLSPWSPAGPPPRC
jgi:hypothetical protein